MSRLVGVSCGNKNLIDISSKRQSDFIESRGKFLTLYLSMELVSSIIHVFIILREQRGQGVSNKHIKRMMYR